MKTMIYQKTSLAIRLNLEISTGINLLTIILSNSLFQALLHSMVNHVLVVVSGNGRIRHVITSLSLCVRHSERRYTEAGLNGQNGRLVIVSLLEREVMCVIILYLYVVVIPVRAVL